MGKKRINQLLDQLKQNQQQDIQNAAGIYTVAHIAIQELQQQIDQAEAPAESPALMLPAASAPAALTKADLEERYGSYNGCRRAAKSLGIRFQGTPRWSQLVQAFEYYDRIQEMVSSYMTQHPAPHLSGLRIEVQL